MAEKYNSNINSDLRFEYLDNIGNNENVKIKFTKIKNVNFPANTLKKSFADLISTTEKTDANDVCIITLDNVTQSNNYPIVSTPKLRVSSSSKYILNYEITLSNTLESEITFQLNIVIIGK